MGGDHNKFHDCCCIDKDVVKVDNHVSVLD